MTFLRAAEDRCTGPEVAFISELLTDARVRGSRLGWGRASTPGVSGRYQVGETETMVWIINLGTGLIEFRVWYVAGRLEAIGQLRRLEDATAKLSGIPKAAQRIEDACKIGHPRGNRKAPENLMATAHQHADQPDMPTSAT